MVNEQTASFVWKCAMTWFGQYYLVDHKIFSLQRDQGSCSNTASSPDGWDEMSAVTGRVFVAQNPEQFTYDADGNMLTDGRFRYTWNAENRLVRAQELCAPTNRNPYTIAYAYDHRGRMVSKRITENDGNDTLVSATTYLWDGWNIIREIQGSGVRDQGSGEVVVTDNVWGLDLDGTLQGAGGVGGLLAVVRSNSSTPNSSTHQLFFPTYDANGNISEYVSTNGDVVAHYDYSPFGETLIESGDLAATFTHRFSTKPWCPITGLYEYQIRKYRPEIGRWLSRDAYDRKEFVNLYTFLFNHSISRYDYLGYDAQTPLVAEDDFIDVQPAEMFVSEVFYTKSIGEYMVIYTIAKVNVKVGVDASTSKSFNGHWDIPLQGSNPKDPRFIGAYLELTIEILDQKGLDCACKQTNAQVGWHQVKQTPGASSDFTDNEPGQFFYQSGHNLSDTPGAIAGARMPQDRDFTDTLHCRNEKRTKLATFKWSLRFSTIPGKYGESRYKGEVSWRPFIMSE